MLTVKIYRQGTCTIVQLTHVTIVDPASPTWDEVLGSLRRMVDSTQVQYRKEADTSEDTADDKTPYKILAGRDIDGSDAYIGLFGTDTCFVTNADGRTIEAVRPKPEPQAPGPDTVQTQAPGPDTVQTQAPGPDTQPDSWEEGDTVGGTSGSPSSG